MSSSLHKQFLSRPGMRRVAVVLGIAGASIIGLIATGAAEWAWERTTELWRDDPPPLGTAALPLEATPRFGNRPLEVSGRPGDDVFGPSGVVIPTGGEPVPEYSDDLPGWFENNGGVAAGEQTIGIEAWGNEKGRVQILNVGVRVVARRAPIEGRYYGPGGGGPPSSRFLVVDLDSEPVTVRPEIFDQIEPVEPWDFPVWVDQQEREIFVVRATTQTCFCSFFLVFTYSVDGRVGRIQIGDTSGEPLQVTGTSRAEPASALPWYKRRADEGPQAAARNDSDSADVRSTVRGTR